MEKNTRCDAARIALILVISSCILALVPSIALARLELKGLVEIYNPVTRNYEPATGMRLRAVLREYVDADTADVEVTVASDRSYSMTINGPWVADGYQVQLLAFAENSGVFEVQSHYMQYDGYQALSSTYYAPDGKQTVKDLRIGGPRSTVTKYQVGGVSGWWADTVDAGIGADAFFLFREASSFRYDLTARAFARSQFEEKEITFASDVADGRYTSFLDYVLINSLQGPRELANTIRHELAHALMADIYPSTSSIFSGGPSRHYLHSVETAKFAWTEGWAEFLAEATRRMKYRPGPPHFQTDADTWGNNLEDSDASWTKQIDPNAEGHRVEGQVASALYDLYDGTGWEKRRIQTPEVPGEEQFWDGVSDTDLRKIENILTRYNPGSFVGGESPMTSFISRWFKSPSYGFDHEVKAICFNRQITLDELPNKHMPERAPTVQIRKTDWQDGNQLQVTCTVGDPDPEDRQYLWLELYVNGSLAQRVRLADSSLWKGKTSCEYVFNQEIAWVQGDTNPVIMVHVTDDMLSNLQVRTVQPPVDAVITKLECEVLGVTFRNNLVQLGNEYSIRDARAGVDVLPASGQSVSGTMYYQPEKNQPGWQVQPGETYTFGQAMAAETVTKPGDSLQINFYAEATYGQSDYTYKARKSVVSIFSRSENLGLGVRTVLIPLVSSIDPNFTLVCEITYRISSKTQKPISIAHTLPASLQPVTALRQTWTPPGLDKLSPTGTIQAVHNTLADQCRLQVRLREIQDELEHRLNPDSSQGKTSQGVQGVQDLQGGAQGTQGLQGVQGTQGLQNVQDIQGSQPAINSLGQPPVLQAGAKLILGEPLNLPTNLFMQRAADHQIPPKDLPKHARERLQELLAEVESIGQRLTDLQKKRKLLERGLNQAAKGMAKDVSAKTKQQLLSVRTADTALQAEVAATKKVLTKVMSK